MFFSDRRKALKRARAGVVGLPRLQFETLEERRVWTAEGAVYAIDMNVDTSALVGSVSAVADWGDGRTTALTVSNQPQASNLKIRFDYRFDSRGFFDTQAKKDLLQLAADELTRKFSDSLAAISPSGSNTWVALVRNPSTGNQERLENFRVAANEIVVFAGSRDLTGSQLGEGSTGAYDQVPTTFFNTVVGRGQPGALGSNPTDFAPWGGAITFDDGANWYFGADETKILGNQSDFVSVAAHELSHVLGFGLSPSWKRFLNGNQFTGPASVAAYDGTGNVPLEGDRQHWRSGLMDDGRETMMSPSLTRGERKLPTRLDLAGLDDLGWQLITPTARVSGEHVYGDDGLFDVKIRLQGREFGVQESIVQASVTNVAPTLESREAMQAEVGVPLSITNLGVFTDSGFAVPTADPATQETFEYRIDWGDGTEADTGTATIDRMGSATQVTLGSYDGGHTYTKAGNFTVRYTVTDDDGASVSKSFAVTVTGGPELILTVDRTTVRENAGTNAARFRLQRKGLDLSRAFAITLTTSDVSELRVPSNLNFAVNVSEVNFQVDAIDDNLLDGTIEVVVQAQAGQVRSNAILMQVEDYELLSISTLTETLSESQEGNRTTGRVTLPFVAPAGGMTLRFSDSPAGQLEYPSTITIPAGGTFIEFPIQARDDFRVELDHSSVLTVQGTGVVSRSLELSILDNDLPLWMNTLNVPDVDGSGSVNPLDALLILNQLNSGGARELDPSKELSSPPYIDPSGDGFLSPVDALIVLNFLNQR